jgi:hypothetical protein
MFLDGDACATAGQVEHNAMHGPIRTTSGDNLRRLVNFRTLQPASLLHHQLVSEGEQARPLKLPICLKLRAIL